jgi:hypothetical protein
MKGRATTDCPSRINTMAIIETSNVISDVSGLGNPVFNAGVPSTGTSEVQTLTIGGTPTGGTFTLVYDGLTTAPITWSATNSTLVANIDAALEALSNIGTGGVTTAVDTMTAGIGTITLTFAGNNAKLAVNTITVGTNSLTGTSPTLAIAETTPGVTATQRGVGKGGLLIDTTNGKAYINTGTSVAPTWTVVGAQS